MADSSGTDAAFGFILFLLFLALLGYAAGGVAGGSAGSTGGTTRPNSGPSGGPVPSCTTQQWPVVYQPVESPATAPYPDKITLTVYVDGGRKCATATRSPWPATTTGNLKVTLAYTANQSLAQSAQSNTETASVQVTDTDNLCITASAEITGTNPAVKVTLPITSSDTAPCTMSVPSTRTPSMRQSPMPVSVAPSATEEGY